MRLVDTHTHLESFVRNGSVASALERADAAGVHTLVTVGTASDDWSLYRELARTQAGRVRYTVGLHPCHVAGDWPGEIERMPAFWDESGDARPVALGEIGLDRFHLPKEAADAERIFGWQQAAFNEGLALAKRLACPIVIHSRGAFSECVEMIDASGVDWRKVVFHCFVEGPAEMGLLMERGGYGSFTGILTYKSADAVREAMKVQGLERLMLETDAPYLTPAPHRGKPNEPAFLRHTAEFAAELLGVSLETLAAKTTATAKAFFKL